MRIHQTYPFSTNIKISRRQSEHQLHRYDYLQQTWLKVSFIVSSAGENKRETAFYKDIQRENCSFPSCSCQSRKRLARLGIQSALIKSQPWVIIEGKQINIEVVIPEVAPIASINTASCLLYLNKAISYLQKRGSLRSD